MGHSNSDCKKNRHSKINHKINSMWTEEQLSLLRSHSCNFYEYVKFIILLIEPLLLGIEYASNQNAQPGMHLCRMWTTI